MAPFKSMNIESDQVESALLGLAIGDALGVPVEFFDRKALEVNPVTGMQESYRGFMLEPGTWSDDTSMTIATMESLIEKRRVDYEHIMDNFNSWRSLADFTASDEVFDIDPTCKQAISRYARNHPALECGLAEEENTTNGSLMRIMPIAFVAHERQLAPAERYQLIKKASSLTHAHPVCTVGCYLYSVFFSHLLEGLSPVMAFQKMQCADLTVCEDEGLREYNWLLGNDVSAAKPDLIYSNTYVVHTLEAACWCLLTTHSFSEAVLQAVNLGEDTDTTAAVTGSLAGLVYGLGGLPAGWLQELLRNDELMDYARDFAATLPKIEV